MMTTMGKLPDDVADALRQLVDNTSTLDDEIARLTLMEWVMYEVPPATADRMMRWAWDRFVEQPKRDALKMAEAVMPEGDEP